MDTWDVSLCGVRIRHCVQGGLEYTMTEMLLDTKSGENGLDSINSTITIGSADDSFDRSGHSFLSDCATMRGGNVDEIHEMLLGADPRKVAIVGKSLVVIIRLP